MDTSKTYQERVAEAVNEAIETTGVTVTWLCGTTGIPRSTMERRLRGLSPFTVAELASIASALRMQPEQFSSTQVLAS